MIRKNVFSLMNPGLFNPIVQTLLDFNDHYMLLADLRSYIEAQDRVNALYAKPREWTRRALINVARSGKFSSDRTIDEYAKEIWNLPSFDVEAWHRGRK